MDIHQIHHNLQLRNLILSVYIQFELFSICGNRFLSETLTLGKVLQKHCCYDRIFV